MLKIQNKIGNDFRKNLSILKEKSFVFQFEVSNVCLTSNIPQPVAER